MIDKARIKDFWEKRGQKFSVPTEELANLESNPELLARKVDQEKLAVLPRLNIKNHMKILDLGAGYGQWSMRFAPYAKSVTAVEYAESMLQAGIREAKKRNLNNINFIHAPAEEFVPDGSYDLAFISGLFLYLDDAQAEKVAKTAVSALKPGGRLFLREAVSLLDHRYLIENRWSEALQSNYSAMYRLPGEFLNLFNELELVEENSLFPPGSPLNKWKETRLHFYLFSKRD